MILQMNGSEVDTYNDPIFEDKFTINYANLDIGN